MTFIDEPVAQLRSPESLSGVVPVLLTPFDATGEPDLDGLRTVIRKVTSAGVRTVMYPGYASEFYRLSETERALLAAVVVEEISAADGSAILSVSDQATVLAVETARRYAALGAAAVNVLPPTTLGGDAAQVRRHLAAVLAACAPVPAIVQFAPALTGSALVIDDLRQLAHQAPNLVAVKVETLPAGPAVSALRRSAPELGCLVGYGGLHLLDALDRGISGVQPGCSFPEIYLAIWQRWQAGDDMGARQLHSALLPYLAYWMQDVRIIVQVEKLIAQRRGWISSDHCRAPDRPLDRHEVRLVDRFLRDFDALLFPDAASACQPAITGKDL